MQETIKARYHCGTIVNGTVISKRQKWRGNHYPYITEYTIKPDVPVMGETELRNEILVDENMVVEDA